MHATYSLNDIGDLFKSRKLNISNKSSTSPIREKYVKKINFSAVRLVKSRSQPIIKQ